MMYDDQLIFLISMPRSGSTMLQKMLGAHTQIYTRSEPWVMLHPLQALKTNGIYARYDASLAARGANDFVHGLPGGRASYQKKLAEFLLSLYGDYLQDSRKARFLDKTPRYYEIFDDLQELFPRAKFIILYRNPLAVFASILSTWVKDNYALINNYKIDLEEGVRFLERDFSGYSNTYMVRYEDLLSAPEKQFEQLCAFLQLNFESSCVNYGERMTGEQWQFGDQKTVSMKMRPDIEHAESWRRELSQPVVRKLLLDYLNTLDRTSLSRLGYDFDSTRSILEDAKPVESASGEVSLSKVFAIDSVVFSAGNSFLQEEAESVAFFNALAAIEQKSDELANSLRSSIEGGLHKEPGHVAEAVSVLSAEIRDLKGSAQDMVSALSAFLARLAYYKHGSTCIELDKALVREQDLRASLRKMKNRNRLLNNSITSQVDDLSKTKQELKITKEALKDLNLFVNAFISQDGLRFPLKKYAAYIDLRKKLLSLERCAL
jgi:hypothetical protein